MSALGPIGGLIGGLFGGKRAAGGPVSAGRSYLTGELGEEAFVPSSAGMMSSGGSVSVNNNQKTIVMNVTNNFNIKSEGGQVTRASMQQVSANTAASMQHALQRSS